MFDTALIAAGTVNSSMDWSMPTKEKAMPVNIMDGNIYRTS